VIGKPKRSRFAPFTDKINGTSGPIQTKMNALQILPEPAFEKYVLKIVSIPPTFSLAVYKIFTGNPLARKKGIFNGWISIYGNAPF